ncbi:MAG: hypothetical protein JWQ77_1670 [Jatrophihabitans sp.]|nr:hypothetical protein [Jatrophihabitans sp.]
MGALKDHEASFQPVSNLLVLAAMATAALRGSATPERQRLNASLADHAVRGAIVELQLILARMSRDLAPSIATPATTERDRDDEPPKQLGRAIAVTDLGCLHRDPVGYLAAMAICAGGPYYSSFAMAEFVMSRRATSGELELADAQVMCEQMRDWGAGALTHGVDVPAEHYELRFARYCAAWHAYQKLRPDSGDQNRFMLDREDSSSPAVQLAANELHLAHVAWLPHHNRPVA